MSVLERLTLGAPCRTSPRRVLLPAALCALLAACGGKSSRLDDSSGGGSGKAGDSGVDGGSSSAGSGTGGIASGGSVSAGTGGGKGSAGSPNEYPDITRVRPAGDRPIDLLLMIDNSLAMAEKQQLLADAMPFFLERLAEFATDVNLGIITSSLGDHGSQDVCSDASGGRTPDDKAQLIPSVRADAGAASPGFLSWQPGADDVVAGDLVRQIRAAGELGCGYEGSLEAWYRFLVDPEPVRAMSNDGNVSVRSEANPIVLEQRANFLRPGSTVGIVMLTDENDCSILDENAKQGWLVPFKGGPMASNWHMPDSTQTCKEDPNSPCCRMCVQAPAPGCGDNTAEQCAEGGYLGIVEDAMNLRCNLQKQRFGVDLLYPTARYVEALTSTSIEPRLDGNRVRNPLFSGPADRRPGDVFLAGVLGVPWQDIATDDSLTDPRMLNFLTPGQLAESGRWDMILGDRDNGVLPADPLMIEAIDPRPIGAPHPLVAEAAVASPGGAATNPINGREQAVDSYRRDDLQFSCIFPLLQPVACNADNAAACDCNADEYARNSPLCRYDSAEMDGTQLYAKAYPGVRQLEVLKGAGEQGLVTSICPKLTEPGDDDRVADPYFGYNPAVSSIARLLRAGRYNNTCLDDPFPTAPTPSGHRTDCRLIVATSDCNCDSAYGFAELADAGLADRVREQIAAEDCGGLPSCDPCLCEVTQLSGDALTACLSQPEDPGDTPGFCYVDPRSGYVNPDLVAECPPASPRIIRVSPEDAPILATYMACPRPVR